MLYRLYILLICLTGFWLGPALAHSATNVAPNTATTADSGSTAPQANAPNASPKPAPSSPDDKGVVVPSGSALIKLFALAVILESALSLLFNWRPFLATFDGRGVKAPISFVAALIVVSFLQTDPIAGLLQSYGGTSLQGDSGWITSIISAMVIAGGSSGVNRMLRALGYRPIAPSDQEAPKPPPGKAWLAVRRVGKADPESLEVEMEGPDGLKQVIGTLSGVSRASALQGYFLRNRGRFPQSGGYAVEPGKEITLRLVANGKRSAAQWGPAALAPGAIIDVALSYSAGDAAQA